MEVALVVMGACAARGGVSAGGACAAMGGGVGVRPRARRGWLDAPTGLLGGAATCAAASVASPSIVTTTTMATPRRERRSGAALVNVRRANQREEDIGIDIRLRLAPEFGG